MKNVFQQIKEWATELPYWEQAALDKILSGNRLSDADYDELLHYLLEDEQLEARKAERKPLSFQHGPDADTDLKKPVRVKEISELENVNALVPDQNLTFSDQLTVVYGLNRSGKSGYARILGSAGFSRGDKDVLPDISKPIDGTIPVKAKIRVMIDGTEKLISHEVGSLCPELSTLYVFDSTSVQVHMKGKNTFSFTPSGLSVLTELSRVTDEVRALLRDKIAEAEQPGEFEKYFTGESKITDQVASLDLESNLEEIKLLAEISTDDENRIHQLNIEIGTIGLEKVQEEIDRLEQQLESIQRLNTWLINASGLLNDKAIEETERLILGLKELKKRVKKISRERFQNPQFSQTGSDLWLEFIQIAHRLAEAESEIVDYPQISDPCLLCQQPLSDHAHQLLLNLWTYLAGDTVSELTSSQSEQYEKQKQLRDPAGFNLKEDLSTALSFFQDKDPDLLDRIQLEVESYNSRGNQVDDALLNLKPVSIATLVPADTRKEIGDYIQQVQAELSTMNMEDLETKRQELEEEVRVLEHRKKLADLLPDIEAYLARLSWAKKATKSGGSTHHITVKYNSIFSQLVTNRYIQIFAQTLEDLGRPLQVDIDTSGQKGKTVKQIVLRTHESAKDIADPDKVLSEGEKRAVALADFLTEVTLDTSSSGIILDDPVTSLDLEWRKTVAQLLAHKAKNRQVVIFTHDMPFLYLLINFADENNLMREVHWVKRGDEDDQPGYVWLNNCPALERYYRKPTLAEQYYKEAKDEPQPQSQERILKNGLAALRSTYEAFIIFEMFNGVVLRFEERISFGRLEEITWDPVLAENIVKTCERLSRYMEGHLHSDALATTMELDPKLLRNELDLFYETRKMWRKLNQ